MDNMTMREALEYLIERADDSDGAQYGTLSTSFVRDVCKRGLASPPKIRIQCETRAPGVLGTTSLRVIRVETEDDGSFTAVTDHWPSPSAKENPANG